MGLRSAEIATILQKSEGAVRVTLSRALKLLRKIYENE
jgi:DNA-directed RNA polymerase specialized sigma24 family protein